MTSPLSFPPLPTPPTGGHRAGDTAGFANLAEGLDDNFASFGGAALAMNINQLHAISVPSANVLAIRTANVSSLARAQCLKWGPWRFLVWSVVVSVTLTFSNGVANPIVPLIDIVDPDFLNPVMNAWQTGYISNCAGGEGGTMVSLQSVGVSATVQNFQVNCSSLVSGGYTPPTTIDYAGLYLASGVPSLMP
jgi:hypothetical protein